MTPSLLRGTVYTAAFALLGLAPASAGAQQGLLGSGLDDYMRLRELSADTLSSAGWNSAFEGRRSAVARRSAKQAGLLPATAAVYVNTDRPWGVNDGAVWQGRGATLALSGGAHAHWGPVSMTIAPLITRSENRAFELSPLAGAAGYSPYAYPTLTGLKIDSPQRFGPTAVTVADWGQSAIRADIRGVSLGFSHENLWWGPGYRNAITMTNNAPGFWHAHLGTSRPASIGVGTVKARWIWGSLRESAWFDTIPSNDRRFITGAIVSFSPRWAPRLEVGGTRTFQQAWRAGGPNLDDILLMAKPLQKDKQISGGNPTGEDEQDQIASLFARWVAPSSGFELYGEWGKGDHSTSFRDLLIQPEHGSGWLFGFQKVLAPSPAATWRLLSEVTLLGAPRSTSTRSGGAGFFYVHGLIPQGHTNRGQVMGAGIGPGSSQALMRLDRFAGWGSAGLSVMRTVYDNDRFYRQPSPQDRTAHEVEPTFAGDVLVMRGPWDFAASLAGSRLLNTHYIPRNDRWNVNLALSARYHPRQAPDRRRRTPSMRLH